MQKYVAGLLFDPSGSHVVLIKKQRPAWQAGLLNAVGGKVEPGESFAAAMRREYREETGLDIEDWTPTIRLIDAADRYEVQFFRAYSEHYAEVESTTDEQVGIYETADIPMLRTIRNLEWLIPMQNDPEVAMPQQVVVGTRPQ